MNQQTVIHFSMEMGMPIITYGQVFLYIRESDQKFRGWRLLVTECNI
jgi:hypothetical protein